MRLLEAAGTSPARSGGGADRGDRARRTRARGPRAGRAPGSSAHGTMTRRRTSRAGRAPATTRSWNGCSSAGVPIDARGVDDGTALHYAGLWGRASTVELLLARGAEVDLMGRPGHAARVDRMGLAGAAGRGRAGRRLPRRGGAALLDAGATVTEGMLEIAADEVAVLLEEAIARGGLLRDVGLEYVPGRPVRVRVRQREGRYEIDDVGRGARGGGAPAGLARGRGAGRRRARLERQPRRRRVRAGGRGTRHRRARPPRPARRPRRCSTHSSRCRTDCPCHAHKRRIDAYVQEGWTIHLRAGPPGPAASAAGAPRGRSAAAPARASRPCRRRAAPARGRPRRARGGRRRGGRARRSAAAASAARVRAGRAAADEHDPAARRAGLDRGAPRVRPADRLEDDVVAAEPAAVIAPSASACARRSAWRSASVTVRPSATSSAASIWPIGPPPSTPASGASARAGARSTACTAAASGSAIAAPAGSSPSGTACSAASGRRSARRSRRAPSAARGRSAGARRGTGGTAARDGVADEHALAGVGAHARRLVAEARRVGRQDRVPAAPHLHVGAARGRRLDADEHLARPGSGSGRPRRAGPPGPCSIAARIRAARPP